VADADPSRVGVLIMLPVIYMMRGKNWPWQRCEAQSLHFEMMCRI
jgi:hypothetical protein